MSRGRRWLLIWLLLAALWIGVIVYACIGAWPSLPLDLSPDAQTRAALLRAVAAHATRCGVLALLPPLLALALGWLAVRALRRLRA